MRHGKKFNHLGRKKGHREAMLSNMASSLFLHKRIFTTTAKAKALRVYVEPIITKGKTDSTHSRRVVFSYLQDKEAVKELFGPIADKVGDRPGGYTRILKTHTRLGDNAEMCMMELVDFNDLMLDQKVSKKSASTKSKRTRRGKKKAETPVAEAVEAAEVETEAPATETPENVEEPKAETNESAEDKE
ncbi:MAG: 50S ribosomal protein L17 [Bacteroidia bacterium]|nr:50S ribosomal protein L17 [Bacteroidia bacterium]